MTDGLLNIDSSGITGPENFAGGSYSNYRGTMHASHLRTAVGWLPTIVILAAAAGLPFFVPKHAATKQGQHTAAALTGPALVTVGLAKESSINPKVVSFDPSVIEAIVPAQPAPVDGVKISSQSWRRGGLGSNAFVTMTLRNNNEYAVKDIDISCAFLRPDGSHLTDRTRLISDAINMRSRKTFARLHVGFVNVNAAKAKCSLLTASHI
jgi:hypothetical protein